MLYVCDVSCNEEDGLERVTGYDETSMVLQEKMKAVKAGVDSGHMRISTFLFPTFQETLISVGIYVVLKKLIPPVALWGWVELAIWAKLITLGLGEWSVLMSTD